MIGAFVGIKHRIPFLWNFVEGINGQLFKLRSRKLPPIADSILGDISVAGCRFSLMERNDIPALAELLKRQDPEYLVWFGPHPFDQRTLERLYRNPAFLMMKVTESEGRMTGYFFLRCFVIGRAFAGLLVDRDWQNRGIGSAIWAACAAICRCAGLRMQATISADNKASVASCHKGADTQQIAILKDNYMAVECRPKPGI